MATRPAAKAGSWYESDPVVLKDMLGSFMAEVPEAIAGTSLPIQSARIVIAPHAGYDFSGACAAWAYKALDLSKAKRVFVLGPSHTYGFEGGAMTTFDKYSTPFGDLTIDRDTAKQVKDAAQLDDMPRRNEIAEHSLEMHMPYLYLRLEQTFGSEENFPPIVPILIGSNNGRDEKEIGTALLPFIKDPENAFVISSDFCHWGDRQFSYSVYSPTNSTTDLRRLRSGDPRPNGPPIHETIRVIDEAAMTAVESGSHDAFLATLRQTKNTVCGRHPIGVMLAALELLGKEPGYKGKGKFNVIQYDRSNLVNSPDDMSVSYVSAYAVA
ncbi:MEMO1 family [Mariannaea sp. PMI_226]|nr:MEMO1 family [Mariannaea sp. PMI_226]